MSLWLHLLLWLPKLPVPPRMYLHLDEGASWVVGLENLNDTRGYAGRSLASGRVTLARQAVVERPD